MAHVSAPLPPSFYHRCPIEVAKNLLGKRLVSRLGRLVTGGWIVETEAYLAQDDSASHAARGCTPGNASMFAKPGTAYVYPIHGRWCFNTTTEASGIGSAVLIRAIEPCLGIPHMQQRRQRTALLDLCRGPARLCEALGITKRVDGLDLSQGRLVWIDGQHCLPDTGHSIKRTPRIGVTSAHEKELRFCLTGHTFVSGPKYLRHA